MVGHIGAPELSRAFRPGIRDEDILPATLAPELLQDLLRGELGFNGVLVSDASAMVGLTSTLPRRELVPAVIAAGCDMFLFMRNADEDFGYMLDGVRNGVISETRLQEALERILGLKASLGLHAVRAGGTRAPAVGALGDRLRGASRDRRRDRRQDRHAREGHPGQPPAHARRRTGASASTGSPAPRTSPAPIRAATSTSCARSSNGRASRCTSSGMPRPARPPGEQGSSPHTVMKRRGERAVRREVRRRDPGRERDRLRAGEHDAHPVVDLAGRRDPLVCRRRCRRSSSRRRCRTT